MESCCWGPRSSSSQPLPSQPKKPSTSSPGAQFRGGNSRWVSPWRTPPAHAALPEGGRSPKLRLNSQVLAHTLLLYQLIMGLPFPSDFLCHTRGPSKHRSHHTTLTASWLQGLAGALTLCSQPPARAARGWAERVKATPPSVTFRWQRRLHVTFPLSFLGKDVSSCRWGGPGGDRFPGVHRTCSPTTLKGSTGHGTGPPARLLSPRRASGSDFSSQSPPGRGRQPSWRTK